MSSLGTNASIPLGGIPIYKTLRVKDGQVFLATDPPHVAMWVGVGPLSYAERTVRDIVIDVFGEPFLRKIGAWQPTSGEIIETLRSAH